MLRSDKLPVADLSPEAVQREVERILASEKFARSKRLRSLLRFTVAQTLDGRGDTLKEYVIGTEVLKKPESYDPRSDSLVRVLASRLRVKLKEYYNNGGSEDPLVIEFPKGKYVPRFQRREQLQTETERKLRARNAYSLGRLLAARRDEVSLAEAALHFEEAVEADAAWAPPHIGLAGVCAEQAFFGFRRPREAWPLARAQAEAALQLDDMSPEAHIALGMVYALFEWRWRDAELHFQKAIERDSYLGAGHLWRALAALIPTGQISAAQQELRRAQGLAPAAPDAAMTMALYLTQRYDEAAGEPGWLGASALLALQRVPEAIEQLGRLDREQVRVAATLGYAYGVAGETEKAEAIGKRLRERRAEGAPGVWIGNCELALIETGLGRRDEAVALLHEAFREREPWFAFLNLDARFASLRDLPKFSALGRRTSATEREADPLGR